MEKEVHKLADPAEEKSEKRYQDAYISFLRKKFIPAMFAALPEEIKSKLKATLPNDLLREFNQFHHGLLGNVDQFYTPENDPPHDC